MTIGTRGSALLIGSVPLASVEEVIAVSARELGPCAHSLPDGEAGGWVNIPAAAIRQSKGLEPAPFPPGASAYLKMRARIRPGLAPQDIEFAPSGYVEIAKSSYEIFRKLRATGAIDPGMRFQVSLPTPFACVAMALSEDEGAALLSRFEAAYFAEVAEIAAAIPHEDLAMQWDAAVEVVEIVEKHRPELAARFPIDEVTRMLARACQAVPSDIPLGVHLCYGNPGGKHVVEPRDTAPMTAFANALTAELQRPLHWIHMPVPVARDDADYFAALKNLKLQSSTDLYLGLVHPGDGLEGAKRRIAAAKTAVRSFGVGTECGLRFYPAAEIPALLRLHRDAAALAAH